MLNFPGVGRKNACNNGQPHLDSTFLEFIGHGAKSTIIDN